MFPRMKERIIAQKWKARASDASIRALEVESFDVGHATHLDEASGDPTAISFEDTSER